VADDAVPVDQDDAVGDVGQRAGRVRAALGFAEQAGVVDRNGRPPCDLQRELEVRLRERRMRFGRDQAECAQRPSARVERDGDGRVEAELVDDPAQFVVVAQRLVEELLRE
jgi:hypothetical protein